MQSLRNARLVARLIAAWFVLAVGVALASPLVSPQGFDLLCTDQGSMRLVQKTSDGDEVSDWHEHCGLCLAQVLAAPPAAVKTAPAHSAQRDTAPRLASAPLPGASRAPLPARGPPALA